jgi:hypothetical protein
MLAEHDEKRFVSWGKGGGSSGFERRGGGGVYTPTSLRDVECTGSNGDRLTDRNMA